jgi:hypothetical protein
MKLLYDVLYNFLLDAYLFFYILINDFFSVSEKLLNDFGGI